MIKRRRLLLAGLAVLAMPAARSAGLLDALSKSDASAGLRQALEQGAAAAVAQLGVQDGFFGDTRFRLPLPETLRQIEPGLRLMGQGAALDELQLTLNRAAEGAVAEARPLLVSAVRSMSVQDARAILGGGEDSVTRFFRDKTTTPLTQKFLPIVRRVTGRLQLASQYDQLAGHAARFGLLKEEDASLDRFVTRRALDALYLRIADEERAIRQNPAEAAGKVARKVFGVLAQPR